MGGKLLKERICSIRSDFLPLKVYPFSLRYLIQKSKQEFMQLIQNIFSKKRQRSLLELGPINIVRLFSACVSSAHSLR